MGSNTPIRYPEHAVAIVKADGKWLGTGVRFRSPHFFLTCAHVVEDYVDRPEKISVNWLGELRGGPDGPRSVIASSMKGAASVSLHPTADLAVVMFKTVSTGDRRRPMLHVVEEVRPGDQVKVLGYTRDMMGDTHDGIAPLALTASEGTIKQVAHRAKPVGKSYVFEGAILNDTIETGLSGGAVYDSFITRRLIGLAAGESSSDGGGKELGWILRLGPYREWLEEQVHCSHGHDDWDEPNGFAGSGDGHAGVPSEI